MLIALTSAKGAPGTTTSALALALSWPRPVLLADLDPRGGDLAWSYGQGRDLEGRGLLSLHVAARHQPMASAVWSQVVTLAPTCWLLPGLDESRHAGTMDWAGLARALGGLDVDVIADCGALPAVKPPADVWTTADLAVLVLRPTLPAVHSAQGVAETVRSDLMNSGLGADRLVSVIVGPGRPYSVGEVTAAMGTSAPVLGALPWDDAAAAVLNGLRDRPRRFSAAPLMAKAGKLALELGGAALDHAQPVGRGAGAMTRGAFGPAARLAGSPTPSGTAPLRPGPAVVLPTSAPPAITSTPWASPTAPSHPGLAAETGSNMSAAGNGGASPGLVHR